MARKQIDSVAKSKVVSLARALDDPATDDEKICYLWGNLKRMLGRGLPGYYASIAKLLTDDQAMRLAAVTDFTV